MIIDSFLKDSDCLQKNLSKSDLYKSQNFFNRTSLWRHRIPLKRKRRQNMLLDFFESSTPRNDADSYPSVHRERLESDKLITNWIESGYSFNAYEHAMSADVVSNDVLTSLCCCLIQESSYENAVDIAELGVSEECLNDLLQYIGGDLELRVRTLLIDHRETDYLYEDDQDEESEDY